MRLRVRPPIKLHEITPAFREHLIKLVEESGGKVAVLVHPFYNERPDQEFALYPHQNVFMEPTSKRAKDVKKIRNYYSSLVKLSKSKKLPLAIVFEGNGEIQKTNARLVKHYPKKEWIYVPTKDGFGSILHGTSWQRVVSVLEELGVRRVFVGGCYFKVFPKRKENRHTGCVSGVYGGLKNGSFAIDVLPKTTLGNIRRYSKKLRKR